MTASASRDRIDLERRSRELPFGMETRDEATNYFAWQAEVFSSILRGTALDHGSGTGGLASAVADLGRCDVVALEPDPRLFEVLSTRLAGRPRVATFQGTLDDYLGKNGPGCLDAIVSSNVIEHIEDDVACLRAMWEALRPGGGVGLYVPARGELFGSMDEAVGHFRRYGASELRTKMITAGFEVRFVKYRNLVGVLPWLLNGRILKKSRVDAGSIRLFDKVIFPVSKRVEDLLPPRYGLNVIAVGVKPA